MDVRKLTVVMICLGGTVAWSQGMPRNYNRGRNNPVGQQTTAPADQSGQVDRQEPAWLRDENAAPPNGEMPKPDDLLPWNNPPAVPAGGLLPGQTGNSSSGSMQAAPTTRSTGAAVVAPPANMSLGPTTLPAGGTATTQPTTRPLIPPPPLRIEPRGH
jgi:hypothetical protein